jgi:hypothetical protein
MNFLRSLFRNLAPLLVLTFFAAPAALAVGDDWMPIDPAHLSMKSPLVEKDADAEVIFWEVRIDDAAQGELIKNHYVRIKIFTERGKESQSRIDILFRNYTKVKDVAARTIRPDGSIIELKKEDVFERTIVKVGGTKLKAKSFAVPGIEIGSIIEYRWREVSGGRWADRVRLELQRDIPVQSVSYYVKPWSGSSYGMRYYPFHVPDSVRFAKDKNGFHKVTMTNVPAFREEPRMPPEDEVRPWILIYYTEDTNSSPDVYWKDLGKSYHEWLKPFIKVNDEVRKASAEIIGDASTDEQKLERLFEYCRTKIKNITDDASGLTPEALEKFKENKTPSDTLKRGAGTSGDIDMLFAGLAMGAGFDARLALTGDRSEIFFDPSFANSLFLSPSSIAIRLGDQWRFFNPGYTYVSAGMLRWQEEGQQALITDPKAPVWVRTPLSAPAKSLEKRTAKLTLSEDGTLEGDVRIEYTGQFAIEHKEYNDDDSAPEREETLRNMVKSRMDTAEVTNVRIENVQDPTKPFVYEYHIRIPGYAQRTGKRVFLQPAFFQRGMSALFATSTRTHDVYFHYPWSEEDEVTFTLPTGFVLESPDAPVPISAQDVSEYKATIGISQDQRTLLYKRKFFFGGKDSILFPSKNYELLRVFFDRVYKSDSHAITLKQAAATAQTSPK